MGPRSEVEEGATYHVRWPTRMWLRQHAPGQKQELALSVGVGWAVEGRTETAGTAHCLAEPGNYPAAVLDRASIELLGLVGGPGQVPGVDHRVRTGQAADQFVEGSRTGESLHLGVGPGRIAHGFKQSSPGLAPLSQQVTVRIGRRSPSLPGSPSTRRWVSMTWSTKSRTVHSSHGVHTVHWSGATPCRRSVKPLETRA